MPRLFGAATSDRIDIGHAADIENQSTWSAAMVVKVNTFTAGRCFFGLLDGSSPFAQRVFRLSGTQDVRVSCTMTGADLNYITNTSPITVGVWTTLVVTCDTAGAAGAQVKVYSAAYGGALASATFGTATDGTGTPEDDSALPTMIGNNGNAAVALQGDIAIWAFWAGRLLTQAEAQLWQTSPFSLDPTRLYVPGWGSPEPDFAGSGVTGTVTGATVSDGSPMAPLWAPFRDDMEYAVAAAASNRSVFTTNARRFGS